MSELSFSSSVPVRSIIFAVKIDVTLVIDSSVYGGRGNVSLSGPF